MADIFILIFELIGELFVAALGALTGVLWPPRTREWARWQRGAVMAAVAAVACFVAAGCFAITGRSPLVVFLILLGCAAGGVFLWIGNRCQQFHERALEADKRGDSKCGAEESANR